jgi:hypothetical protein
MRSSLLESIIVTELQITEAYTNLNLTKAKYGISNCLWWRRKIARISLRIQLLNARWVRSNHRDGKNTKVTVNEYTHILNTVTSQNMKMYHIRFHGKRNNPNFTSVKLRKIYRSPTMHTTNTRL